MTNQCTPKAEKYLCMGYDCECNPNRPGPCKWNKGGMCKSCNALSQILNKNDWHTKAKVWLNADNQ